MNELIIAGILAAIGLVCAAVFSVPYAVARIGAKEYKHRKLMQPQNVYFRWEV